MGGSAGSATVVLYCVLVVRSDGRMGGRAGKRVARGAQGEERRDGDPRVAMEGSSPQESLIIWRFIHSRVCVCL